MTESSVGVPSPFQRPPTPHRELVGTLFRAALGAQGPLREIAEAILAAKGVREATAKQRAGIETGARSSLENHAGNTVQAVGEGIPKRWSLL
jgi:hypothetical protein